MIDPAWVSALSALVHYWIDRCFHKKECHHRIDVY